MEILMVSANEQLPGADLCVIVPVFNEAVVLDEFCTRMLAVLEALDLNWQLLFIDDGRS